MNISIIAFDNFTDIDVFFLWDLLKRVKHPEWKVQILGEQSHHTSKAGLTIPMHGHISLANNSDVVLFASGPETRLKMKDQQFLQVFALNPEKQLIGSMCSGALILAALSLLDGKRATTYPTAKAQLESFGVTVVEQPFVCEGNIATAAGCLSAQYLVGWVIERLLGTSAKETVLKSIAPVSEGLSWQDIDMNQRLAIATT